MAALPVPGRNQQAMNQPAPNQPPAPMMNAAGMMDPAQMANATPPQPESPGSQLFADIFNPNRPADSWRDPNAQFGGSGQDPVTQAETQFATNRQNRRDAQFGSNASFDADMQRRIDEFYAEAERSLNPMWETRAREFEQSLIGRGIDPNSEAGQRARADFDRARNDAFNSARNQATQFGAGLQNQRWQQQFAQDQADAQMEMQMLASQAAQMNATNALDFERRRFNEDTRRFDLGFGEDRRRYDQGFDFNMGRADMADLMTLLGFDRDTVGMNNQFSQAELSQILPFLSLIPQGGPTGIDVMNPYNLQMQAQQAQANQAQATNNARSQTFGQVLQALPFFFPSDERVKEEIRQVGTLHNGLPVYAYRYKAGGPTHIGVMAQDVEKVKPEAVIEVGGVKMVNYDAAVA